MLILPIFFFFYCSYKCHENIYKMNLNIHEIAHRGDSHFLKDNTIQSFDSAINKDFDMIETDIQLTKDNVIIVYHNTFITRKINSSFPISFNKTNKYIDYAIDDLDYYDIKSIDNDIMTLKEFLDRYNNKIKIYLDIKGNTNIVTFLISILNQYNTDNIFIGSFNILIIDTLRELNNKLKLGIISENAFPIDILDIFIRKYNPCFFSYHWTVLTKLEIDYLRSKNISVFTYTNKSQFIADTMKKYNISGIVTNYKIN